MTSAAELTAIAIEIAETAADHARVRRGELFDDAGAPPQSSSVSTKSTPTDPVTVADTETETLIRAALTRLRPDDTVLGEEDGGTLEVPEGVRWVVDPIDGTVNFLYGIPAYAVSVGAQVDGVSVAGAVVDVARRVTYSATRGAGAFRDDGSGPTRLRCTDVSSVALALVATGFGYDEDRRRAQGAVIAELLPRVRDLRRVGSAALDLCMVASGSVDAHFEHGLNPWDWAAGALIAEEAGAVVTVPGPETRGYDGAVTMAVAPGIATEFTDLLERIGALGSLP
ncbi:inositol monophosphatase family protein [Williamsia phyllosphaerae]|uniref:Inositol-1-monophosphatase n=1 Tax=Williamsia phyllosphaerae TaxID=885042 RepID=A0ABQ1V8I2_9NOCA|nr:inositol monophosphatase family protein [Williamsia phyllosphaerae]GGF40929.1 putative inositol-1-monophosphatase SuhB [Williamsia phyllosphaerae]